MKKSGRNYERENVRKWRELNEDKETAAADWEHQGKDKWILICSGMWEGIKALHHAELASQHL